ncbi:MAG: hypothetical protein EOR68_08460 [Mesorhizobium sp.]|uniref:hypothetical protein n=1 Tax=Mesorhizobium sp. TaxID=1871066 RepID=UPI000FE51568|nr:hypothetical protein [Mesorhizobium sp.]RWM02128.1 MAG: hypothetical protein EOR68_08460 [Mesorhizobium sp.]
MIRYELHETMPQPATSALVEKSLIERMADRVLELGMNGIAVTKDALFEHTSFTLEQIEQHGREACNLARSRAFRQMS